MSEEEIRAEETVAEDSEPAPKKKGIKKWPIVLGVILVVIIAAGVGVWTWHETPSFCGAICHTPMDNYLATYESEYGEATTDKWGNEVEDSSAMLAVSHAVSEEDGGAGAECLDCHQPIISQQISEGLSWLTGGYTYPLTERSLEELTATWGVDDEEEFCLNEDCHDMTRDDLIEATSDMTRNPHVEQHGSVSCSECHKAHRASVFYCTQCHSDCDVPDGWLTVSEANALEYLYTEE